MNVVDSDGNTRPVVVGLHSNSEKSAGFTFISIGNDPPHLDYEWGPTGTGNCTEGGKKQRAVRMNSDKANWIESKKGDECLDFTAQGNFPYRRCF